MAKLHRPYIPLKVRVAVALRQVKAQYYPPSRDGDKDGAYLKVLLAKLFGERKCHLDHDPALCNRRKATSASGAVTYTPRANNPKYLIYREGGAVGGGSEHDIKTRVRGENGQLSDLALARKEKRRLRSTMKRVADRKQREQRAVDRTARSVVANLKKRGAWPLIKAPKKIQSRGFPPKGSRKFRSA